MDNSNNNSINDKKFRALLENAFDGVVIYNKHGNISFASNSLIKICGYDENELIGNPATHFIHPDDHNKCINKFNEVSQVPSGKRTFRFRLIHKNGSVRWCETMLTNLLHEPSVNGVISNIRDITKRKEAEDKLRESNQLLKSINYNISEALYRNVPYKEFLYVNQAFLKLFEFDSLQDLNKISPQQLYANDKERRKVVEFLEADGKATNVKVEFKKKNGTPFWGLISSKHTFHEGKMYYDGAIRDISEEIKAQEKLEANENLFSSINLNIKEGIFRSSFKDGLIYVNNAIVEMFGFDSHDDMMKCNVYDLYYDNDTRNKIIERLKVVKTIQNEEILLRKKNGEKFWGLMSCYINEDKNGLFFDGAVRDISELKEVENKLKTLNDTLLKQNRALENREDELKKALKELSDRNFELDQIVYKTSHDLRSPLSSILGLLHVAKKDHDQKNKDLYFSHIENSIKRLDEFVKSMLNYAKASRTNVNIEKLELKALIQECISDLEYLDSFSKIKTSISINGEHAIVSDKLRLKIIFSNIISNAYKYFNRTEAKSYLKINTSISKDKLIVIFEDNGLGIEKQYLTKIYDMFFRASEDSKGSGLGMYIVKQAIDKLNGSITVESEIRKGTKITIEIPSTPA